MEMEEVQIKQDPGEMSDAELNEARDMEAHLQDMSGIEFRVQHIKDYAHVEPTRLKRRKYRGDMTFIQAVARVGQALLDRSQAPEAKQEKRRAAEHVCQLLWRETGFHYTVAQVYKKVSNLKHRAKLTIERCKHVPPDLKMWLELLPAEQRSRMSVIRAEKFETDPLTNDDDNIFSDDLQIVDECEGIITVSAAENLNTDESLFMSQVQGAHVKRRQRCTNCPICYKTITLNQRLHGHLELHRQNRFFCMKNCFENFETLEECELHELMHHGVKNLKCHVCNHKFPSYEVLQLHREKMHSKLETHFCSICREWFISKEELLEHWQSLPDSCGRILHMCKGLQGQLKYKLRKSASIALDLKHLKLKTVDLKMPSPPPDADCGVKIKQEPLDDEYAGKEQVLSAFDKKDSASTEISVDDIKIKTEPVDFEAEDTELLPQVPPELLPFAPTNASLKTGALAVDLNTSALKTVPDVINFTIKTESVDPDFIVKTEPESLSDVNVKNEVKIVSATKVLKLQNLKIVKLPPKTNPKLVTTVAPKCVNGAVNATDLLPTKEPVVANLPNTQKFSIEFTTPKGQRLLNNSNFTLKEIIRPLPLAAVDTNSAGQLDQWHKAPAVPKRKNSAGATETAAIVPSPNASEPIASEQGDDALNEAKQRPSKAADLQPIVALSTVKPNERVYICPKCGRQYSTKTILRIHLRANCGKEPMFKCEECNKCFSSAGTLAGHRSVHTGELPHKCNFCDKRFRTRGQVNVHHRTHTGERPFVCEVCSTSFRHRETLISHLSRHIGMKRYKCYSCGSQFACISGLRMHRFTRPETCGKSQLNTRAIGPRVRVIKGQVMFEPEPPADSFLRASVVQNIPNQ